MSENMFSKKCDACGIQPAMLFFRTFKANSNDITEEGLCPQCALKKFTSSSDMELENKEVIQSINQMRHILSDIVGHINKIGQQKSASSIEKCQICGTSTSTIKNKNKAGCSFCYQEFKPLITEHLKLSSFGSKHRGQIPQRYRSQYLLNLEIEKLKLKLQVALRNENFEEAAKISKRIAKLDTNHHH